MAPHRYPFRLIDRGPAAPGEAAEIEVLLTANAALLRGEGPLSLFLLLEIAAQAVLELAGGEAPGGEPTGGQVLLAGVEEMRFAGGAEGPPPAPPLPGDRLVLRASREASFAKLLKVRVEIDRDGARLAEAVLLLAAS